MPKSLKTKSNSTKKFYVVRDIIDYRVQDGQQQFLIYWKDYSKSQSTWETLETLQIKKGLFEDIIQQWREVYRITQARNQKMGQQQTEEFSKFKEIAVKEENKKKNNDSIWLKFTQQLIKQSKLWQFNKEKEGAEIQIQKAPSSDNKQLEDKFQMQGEPIITDSKSICDEVSKQNCNPNMLSQGIKNRVQKKKISKSSRFDKPKDLQKNSQQSNAVGKIPSSFEKLPVNKIVDKVIIKGQIMYELQLKYNQIHCEGIYFHQKYVKNLWGELLDEFTQKKQHEKYQAGMDTEH